MLGRRKPTSSDPARPLTFPPEQCLAKSRKSADGKIIAGRLVQSHCHIVGAVARELIDRMPTWLAAELFPAGAELIAAAHDIGKVSPTFQKKVYSALSESNEQVDKALNSFQADIEIAWGGHAGVSQATAATLDIGKFIPEILGQHHGFSPNLSGRRSDCEVFGGTAWHDQRSELLSQLKQVLDADFPKVKSAIQARALAGLTTISDWIGSGPLFENPDEQWQDKIKPAVDSAGFVRPILLPDLSFADSFGFSPKPTQIKLFDAVTQPGVYVLEAPMGLGKTEAALYAAYKLLATQQATGIYFALPTQLTSDKIHERLNAFLTRILSPESPHHAALLVHGNAWLKQFEMGEEGNPGGAWFSQGKRSILAPFAVGTIDQALMAVMNVKHGFVRTFGLAGKVVILDEVHAYDSFTGTILDELINALRRLHCTVIILSATLTHERRSQLLGAPSKLSEYPLITAQPNNGTYEEIAVESSTSAHITIFHAATPDAVEEVLRRAVSGQQVLWIENTVNEAQGIFKLLSARAAESGVATGLLHSRYVKSDRADNEEIWVTHFGKAGTASRAQFGRILIGTQVLEQSLDIDADFLVTRIAPTDMLLQRIGRLWRHENTPRPADALREAWILSPDLESTIADPQAALGASANVYAPYVLCRSLAVWQPLSHIELPSQIRDLIEATYVHQDETEQMARHLHQLEAHRHRLKRLALVGISQGGTTLPEEKAQTRHAEMETTTVLLIRSLRHDPAFGGTSVTLLNQQTLWVTHNGRSLPRQQWREISATLMQNTLQVADYLAPDAVNRTQINWLADYIYLGRPDYEENVMLRIGIVSESGVVYSIHGGNANENYQISYDALIGYQTVNRR